MFRFSFNRIPKQLETDPFSYTCLCENNIKSYPI
nr:MAG TPA: hypothetical protein [Caudoviricetes sp.]